MYVFLLCGLASALSARSLDPLVTLVARDFAVPVATAALISSAYAFPFSLSQPVLGPLGDFYGKERVLKYCVWGLGLCLVACALAPEINSLLAFRLLSGIAAGGIMPVAMAVIGDRIPMAGRQLAIGRFLIASQIGMIFGASFAGYIGDTAGWRTFIWLTAVFTLVTAALAQYSLPTPPSTRTGHISVAHAVKGYVDIFAKRKALVCFATVFFEGMSLFAVMPFIAALLESHDAGSAREAGFVVGAMGLGSLSFSLTLPLTLRFFRRHQMMAIGGIISVAGIVGMWLGLAWPAQAALFFVSGFGFFLLHNSLHAEVSELSQTNRASAFSMHAFWFFLGQAVGPVICGLGLHWAGPTWLLVNIATFAAAGIGAAIFFSREAAAKAA
jgi:predicted MFS family arabinose efflux permease